MSKRRSPTGSLDEAQTASSRRPPTQNFRRFVDQQIADVGELPSVHISDGLGFRAIMQEGRLTAEPCPVFNEEPLLYLFYGRPSYRVNSQVLASAIRAYAPVCLVLKPGVVQAPARVFPFDSGAFNNELFRSSMHRKMQRDDFALEPAMASAQRLVRFFFGDNESYYDARPIPSVTLPPLDFEAASYHALITDRQENVYDERISSIEIQVAEGLPLRDIIDAVILPDAFLDENVVASIEAIGAVAIPYPFLDRLRPELYTATLYPIVKDFYRQRGYL